MPINKLRIDDGNYPLCLKQIHDPPKELYYKGNVDLISAKCIAIVGTRRATRSGLDIARKIAKELASYGFVIVSGLAEGIDTQAHLGALDAGGKTIAVFGCGIDKIFPAANEQLAGSIEEKGLLLSEYEPGFEGAKWTFPKRNRIIAGLSLGVVMVEGHYDSGAMITAKLAIDEGRDVFAVPGDIALDQSKGPHWLIKQGAKLVESAADILEEYDINIDRSEKREERKSLTLSFDEEKVYSMLSRCPIHIDELNIPAKDAIRVLSVLELKGAVKSLPGKYFVIS
jgi:DNA processing protein